MTLKSIKDGKTPPIYQLKELTDNNIQNAFTDLKKAKTILTQIIENHLDIHSIKKILYYYSVDGKGFHSVYEINNKIDKINNPWNKIDKEVCTLLMILYFYGSPATSIHGLNTNTPHTIQ